MVWTYRMDVLVVVPAFTVYTAALSLKYVRTPRPLGESRREQSLFCSFSLSPSVWGVAVFGGFPFFFLELWASRPRAPSQEPADRVRSSSLVETKGADPNKPASGTDPTNVILWCAGFLFFYTALKGEVSASGVRGS